MNKEELIAMINAEFQEVFKRLDRLEEKVADLTTQVSVINDDLDIMEYAIYEEFQDVRKRLGQMESQTVNEG